MSKIPLKAHAASSRFEEARTSLNSFRKQNPEFVEEHDHLLAAYNDAIEELRAVYKDNHEAIGKKLGDFSCGLRRSVDAGLLMELAGEQIDPDIIEVKYSVNKKLYDKAVDAGDIPPSVVQEVESYGSPTVRGPKALSLYSEK